MEGVQLFQRVFHPQLRQDGREPRGPVRAVRRLPAQRLRFPQNHAGTAEQSRAGLILQEMVLSTRRCMRVSGNLGNVLKALKLRQDPRTLCCCLFFFVPCRQIPWDKNENKLLAWKEARTGFPWIDAAMTQLKEEGCVLGTHLAQLASLRLGTNWA